MNWFDGRDIEENKTMACLSYISLLFLIPLLARPQSRFCRAHANQGILLCLVAVGSFIVTLLFSVIPFIGFIISLIFSLIFTIGIIVMAIIKIVEALGGKYKDLPLIGQLRILK
jgi:uncharacterized membrane protein